MVHIGQPFSMIIDMVNDGKLLVSPFNLWVLGLEDCMVNGLASG